MMQDLPYVDKVPKSESDWFSVLVSLARYLRSPEGCPWDRERTPLEFAGFVRDEAVEYIEAVQAGDAEDIEEEFGDCLFTLLASMAAAEELGLMKLDRALEAAHEKMVRRHAHVFADEKAETPEDAVLAWERIKAKEKRR